MIPNEEKPETKKDDELVPALKLPNPDHIHIGNKPDGPLEKCLLSDPKTLTRLHMKIWSESTSIRGKKLAAVMKTKMPKDLPQFSEDQIKTLAEETIKVLTESLSICEMSHWDEDIKVGQGVFVRKGKKIRKGTCIVLSAGTLEDPTYNSNYAFGLRDLSNSKYAALEPSNIIGKLQYAAPPPDTGNEEQQWFSPTNYQLDKSVDPNKIAYANVKITNVFYNDCHFICFETTEDVVGPAGLYTADYGVKWWLNRGIIPYLFYKTGEILGPSQAKFSPKIGSLMNMNLQSRLIKDRAGIDRALDKLEECTHLVWLHHTYNNQLFLSEEDETKRNDVAKHLKEAGLTVVEEIRANKKIILIINEPLHDSLFKKISQLQPMPRLFSPHLSITHSLI